jgi:hypothetical protein
MNYTFIPAGEALPHEQDDCIIMTTSRDTKKFINICAVRTPFPGEMRLTVESTSEYSSSRLDYSSTCFFVSSDFWPQCPNFVPTKHQFITTFRH